MREITLNGVKYPVSFGTLAIYNLQKELNLTGIEKVFDCLNNGVDFASMAIIFWQGLRAKSKSITLEQTLSIIDTEQDGEFMEQFGDITLELAESITRLIPQSMIEVENNSKNVKNPA